MSPSSNTTLNKSKPCLSLVRLGSCRRGDTCWFAASHQWDVDALKRRSMCLYFHKGLTCPRGDGCLWLHEEHRSPCIFFRRGKCTKGEHCTYLHATEDSETNTNANANSNVNEDDEHSPCRKRGPHRSASTPAPREDDEWTEEASDSPVDGTECPPTPTTPSPSPEYSEKNQGTFKSQAGSTKSKTPASGSASAESNWREARPTNPEHDNHHHHHKQPRGTAPIVPGAQGIDAYKRGDFCEAIAVFDKTLLGTLEHATRVSLISNRAHAYEKLAIRRRDKALVEKALEDCDRVMTLVGSSGHFKTTLLRARILLDKESPDDAIHFSKLAAKLSCTADEKVKAMDLLDCAMAARIAARRRADELERAAAAERERAAEQQRRAQETLDEFEQMAPHEILGVSRMAPSPEVRTAYRKLSMKYHPDRPGGDHKVFQKIEEAYRSMSLP